MENNVNIQTNAKVFGINDEKLKKLILEIYDYRDKMSKILEDAEILAASTETFYKTTDGIEFRSKFKKFSSCFPAFLSNIKGYGEALEKVLSNHKKIDKNSTNIFDFDKNEKQKDN